MGVPSSGSKSAEYEVRNHPHPILSTHTEYSLSEFPYEKPDRHHLPDDCLASWECGDEFYILRRDSICHTLHLQKKMRLGVFFTR